MLELLNPSQRSRILVIRQALHFDKRMVDDQANPLFVLLPFASVGLNLPLFVSRSIYAGAANHITNAISRQLAKSWRLTFIIAIG
jgi:hypothetical protein